MNRDYSIAASIYLQITTKREWRDPDSNRGHHDFQSCALPTELSRRKGRPGEILRYGIAAIKRRAGGPGPTDLRPQGLYPASAKRFNSKADSTISLGSAPTTALGCSPGSKNAMVGMLDTPKVPASVVSASTSIFATFTVPSYSAAIWSMTGATCLHGPHHAAQKSTNTGTSDFKTSSSKVSAVTATGSDILYLLVALICSLVYFGVKESVPDASDRETSERAKLADSFGPSLRKR